MSERDFGQSNSHIEKRPTLLPAAEGKGYNIIQDGREGLPHNELVRDIKQRVSGLRQSWEKTNRKGTFDPIQCLGETLTNSAMAEGFSNSVRPEHAKTSSAYRLSRAFDALTLPYLGEKDASEKQYKEIVTSLAKDNAATHGRYVTLQPKEAKLLNAMLGAIDIPIVHGENSVDTLKNIPDAQTAKSSRLLTYVRRFLPEEQAGDNKENPAKQSILSIILAFISSLTKDPTKNE
jgi:hypothetical protein